MKTKVVNIKNDDYDVLITRPSKWGNPFTHLKGRTTASFVVKNRTEAIAKYREYILNNKELLADLKELEGKTLGCVCKPKSCHGDVLVELVNDLKKESLI